jgi:hypothetical protein
MDPITLIRVLALTSLLTCVSSNTSSVSGTSTSISIPGNDVSPCSNPPTVLRLSDPPYENYFYSDCLVDAQAVVTSPLPESNLSIIGPRLIVAWPAGNSGVCAFFAPQSGVNGSLGIEIVNSTDGQALQPVSMKANGSQYPSVGISGVIRFNASATLTVPLLGSIRTIRDFTEGPSILVPEIQMAIHISSLPEGGATLSRLWLDNITTTNFGFIPRKSSQGAAVKVNKQTLSFTPGDYVFYADFNYPQLTQLNASVVLNSASQGLISQQPDQTTSLSFLSYTDKLLAGAWRFLTYFGRDSMIAALLLQPVLSDQAIEAVIGAVLERINRTDGSVCHEETIGLVLPLMIFYISISSQLYLWGLINPTRHGVNYPSAGIWKRYLRTEKSRDYATYLNEKNNITSAAPLYDYKMVGFLAVSEATSADRR